MAKKKIKAVVKLQIQAGKANPAPPIGPALAQHGINLMGFCKEYNGAPERQHHPGGDHDLPGFVLHLRPQDPAHGGSAAQGRRRPQGVGRAESR